MVGGLMQIKCSALVQTFYLNFKFWTRTKLNNLLHVFYRRIVQTDRHSEKQTLEIKHKTFCDTKVNYQDIFNGRHQKTTLNIEFQACDLYFIQLLPFLERKVRIIHLFAYLLCNHKYSIHQAHCISALLVSLHNQIIYLLLSEC